MSLYAFPRGCRGERRDVAIGAGIAEVARVILDRGDHLPTFFDVGGGRNRHSYCVATDRVLKRYDARRTTWVPTREQP